MPIHKLHLYIQTQIYPAVSVSRVNSVHLCSIVLEESITEQLMSTTKKGFVCLLLNGCAYVLSPKLFRYAFFPPSNPEKHLGKIVLHARVSVGFLFVLSFESTFQSSLDRVVAIYSSACLDNLLFATKEMLVSDCVTRTRPRKTNQM